MALVVEGRVGLGLGSGSAGGLVTAVTQGTKKMRQAILSLGSSFPLLEHDVDTVHAKLSKIVQSCLEEEKCLIHLQLLFHLPFDKEFDKVHEDPGNLTFIVPPPMSQVRIPVQVYASLVVEDGDLLSNFLQVPYLMGDKVGVQQLLEAVVSKLKVLSNDQLLPLIVFMLGKTCRRFDDVELYHKLLWDMLDVFVKSNLYEKHDKLHILIRLAGTLLMKKEDYSGMGSDLLELLGEWSFDLSQRIGRDTRSYLSEFFPDPYQDKEEGINVSALQLIQSAIISDLSITSNDEQEWKLLKKTSRLTWFEFISVHSFLAKSLFDKYSNFKENEEFNELLCLVTNFANSRPKLTKDDFEGDIQEDFEHYYKVLKRFGDKERDRYTLIQRFVNFSYQDVYLSKEGIQIAKKYLVPSGDFETVKTYIERAFRGQEEGHGKIPPETKMLIQMMLCSNPQVKGRREQLLIPVIFKDGIAHSDLIFSDFWVHVNSLCSKIGRIEKEDKDKQQIEHNRELVFCTCLQDPVRVIAELMRHSIVSKYFKALEYSKPFMSLYAVNSGKKIQIHCLEQIIDLAEPHDPILSSLAESVSYLISFGIIEISQLLNLLKTKILNLLNSLSPNVKKASRLYQSLPPLASTLLASSENQDSFLIQELLEFVSRSKTLSFCVDGGRDMFQIRSVCSLIIDLIRSKTNTNVAALDKEENIAAFVKSASLLQLGFLYVRDPSTRETIADFLSTWNWMELCDIQDCLLRWVHDTDSEEWENILCFLDLVPIYSINLLQQSIHFCWDSCILTLEQPIIRQYFKFFNKAVLHLFKAKKGLPLEQQLDVISSLILLAKKIYASMKRRKSPEDQKSITNSLQQLYLLILELVNVILALNEQEHDKVKEQLVSALKYLPQVTGVCQPIRACILDSVLYFEDKKNIISIQLDLDEKKEVQSCIPKLEDLVIKKKEG